MNLSFDDFRDEWLADVRAGEPSTTELGHRFARKLLTQWRDIDDGSDDLVYCDGAGDGGIDIAYLDRGEGAEGENDGTVEGHIWYLVQSKYGSAFRGTATLFEEAQKVIDTLDGHRARLSSLTEGLRERLLTFRRAASERDKMVLVFATEDPLTEEQKRALDGVRAMGRERLGSLFDVEAVSVATIHQRAQEEDVASEQGICVPIEGSLVASGKELMVGSVPLLSLYRFLKEYRDQTGDLDQLYERNVRRFLGSRGRVNKAMMQTLVDSPERFGLYNNGITIVVEDFDERASEPGKVDLLEPSIVNGCQTTRTIWEVCRQRLEAGGTGSDPKLEAWREKAENGVVVAKIVQVGAAGEELLQRITRYTNSQNAVREQDFLALKSDFRTWKVQMADRYNVFLEVQRGGWDSQRALQNRKPSLPKFTEYTNAFDLLKVYGSCWLGEAGTAFGRNAAFLPNGTLFRKIVGPEGQGDGGSTPFGVDDLYAAYLLQKAADGFRFGRGAPQHSRRQTRFLFYMVVGELLRSVLLHTQRTDQREDVTRAFLCLFTPGKEPAADALMQTSIGVIDEYLTQSPDVSVFNEPAFRNTFNSDLNGYLKWEQLGKTETSSPRFRDLLALNRMLLGKPLGGQPSGRDMIAAAISG